MPSCAGCRHAPGADDCARAFDSLLSLWEDCASIHEDTRRSRMHLAQQFDHRDIGTASSQATRDEIPASPKSDERPANHPTDARSPTAKRGGFDRLALSTVILIAAIFSIAGRLYSQPTTSLVPIAVLSASGCGLLITALRKLRTSKGAGLLEAALAGLFVATFQFLAALSYPGVTPSLGNEQLAGPGFFTTWV